MLPEIVRQNLVTETENSVNKVFIIQISAQLQVRPEAILVGYTLLKQIENL